MRKKLLIVLGILVVLLVVAYLGVSYVLYQQLSNVANSCDIHAANRPDDFRDLAGWWGDDFDYASYAFPPSYETVRFPSRQEGLNIAGWYMEAAADAPAVILVHGLGSCKHAPQILVPAFMLWRNGFNVLMIDVRDVGDSDIEDGRSAIGNEEYQDALGAWDWLQTAKGIPPERIGILGNSLGAATALIAFDQEPRLAAIFVDSPFENLPQIIREELTRNHVPTFMYTGAIVIARLAAGNNIVAHNPSDAVRDDNGRPMFIVHGTGDTRVLVSHTERLAALAQETGANVTVWIVPGVEHVQTARDMPAEYEQRLVAFFRDALGGGGR